MMQAFACCQADFTSFIAADGGLGPRVVGAWSSMQRNLGSQQPVEGTQRGPRESRRKLRVGKP